MVQTKAIENKCVRSKVRLTAIFALWSFPRLLKNDLILLLLHSYTKPMGMWELVEDLGFKLKTTLGM
jgi:hypothetical protein